MINLLKKILLGKNTKEYISISINSKIKEKVFLKTQEDLFEISDNHWLLCLDPIIFGIWLPINQIHNINMDFKIFFVGSDHSNSENDFLSEVTLRFFDKLEGNDGYLLLLEAVKNKTNPVRYFKRIITYFIFYYKLNQSFLKFNLLVNAFSYPRKVYIVSFQENSNYSLFPMDLVGEIKHQNMYVFGLRHSNIALSGIIKTGKIVISEVISTYKNYIYQLGGNHRNASPTPDQLPFKLFYTQAFKFPLPEWVKSYKEIKITQTINLGSHMLLWGEVVEEVKLQNISNDILYHTHSLYHTDKSNKSNYALA